jgi:4-hydroxy-tetrahydrodipicolinate reductase
MKEKTREKTFCKPELKVILYGVGSIGSSIANLLLKKRGVKIVGAIDSSPKKIGLDLGELIGTEKTLGIEVSNNLKKLLSEVKVDIAIHATSSFLTSVHTELVELIKNNVNIISTCEELSYPQIADKDITSELNDLAKEHGVTVLGTGVNPGFLMDTLVITLTGVCQDIKHIKVERVLDATKRRIPFQKKIGAGLTTEEFR